MGEGRHACVGQSILPTSFVRGGCQGQSPELQGDEYSLRGLGPPSARAHPRGTALESGGDVMLRRPLREGPAPGACSGGPDALHVQSGGVHGCAGAEAQGEGGGDCPRREHLVGLLERVRKGEGLRQGEFQLVEPVGRPVEQLWPVAPVLGPLRGRARARKEKTRGKGKGKSPATPAAPTDAAE